MSDDSIAANSFPAHRQTVGLHVGRVRAHPEFAGAALPKLWRQILIGIVLLEIPLQIDTFLFHDVNEAQFGAISGFNISLTTICLFFLYLQWLPRQIVTSARILCSKSLLFYLAISALSILWAGDRVRTLYDLFLLFQAFLIFIYFVNNTKTRSDVLFAMAFLAIGLLIQGTLMVTVWLIDREISLGPIAFNIGEIDHRVTGSFGSPNVACSFVAILLAPCLSLLLIPTSRYLKLLAIAAMVPGSAALVLTMSRGGWLAAAFSLTIFIAVATRKGWLSGAKLGLTVLCVVVFAAGFLPILATRLLSDDAGSAASRMPLDEISLLMIAQHPLGVGANNWDVVGQRYAEKSQFREEWYYTVHNKYLLVWAEVGLIGLVAYIAFLLATTRRGWRAWNSNDQILAPLALGFTAAIAGQMVHMLLDIFNSRAQVQMLWLIAAFVFAIANLSKAPERDPDFSNQ